MNRVQRKLRANWKGKPGRTPLQPAELPAEGLARETNLCAEHQYRHKERLKGIDPVHGSGDDRITIVNLGKALVAVVSGSEARKSYAKRYLPRLCPIHKILA